MTTKLQPVSEIAACCDNEAVRYALSNVLVIPNGGSEVYATATDGRVCSITVTTGETDHPCLIPCGIFKGGRKNLQVTKDGDLWRNNSNKVAEAVKEGWFPMIPAVTPPLEAEYSIALRLDANLLHNVAKAINERGENIVTLFLKPSDSLFYEEAIPVVGQLGVGVVSPAATNGKQSAVAAEKVRLRDFYETIRSGFKAAWEKCIGTRGFNAPLDNPEKQPTSESKS